MEETLSPYPRREEAYPALMWPFAEVEAGVVREERAEYVAARLESMGQLNNAYIVARGPEGLVVVDQHAAHEQVLFERLLGGGGTAQPVSPPVRVELTPREAERLEPFLALLADLGTEVEPFGRSTFLIRTLPAPVASSDPRELLEAVLGELPGCRRLEPEAARERLAMKIACTAAVKAGDILSDEEMQALLDDLTAAWSPATCPHGRPAFVLLTVEELERRFMRR